MLFGTPAAYVRKFSFGTVGFALRGSYLCRWTDDQGGSRSTEKPEEFVTQARPLVVTVDRQAVEHLVDFCREQGRTQLFMIADKNTYAAQGRAVEAALTAAGFDLKKIVFTNDEVIADGEHVFAVMRALDTVARTFVAVGSGTITDITRFVSHRTRSVFISMPTAPSVDGFTSTGAPMIIAGVKKTVYAHAPIAIFADIGTLTAAPQAMIAAGFGDMLGKYTSIADWLDAD